MRDVELRVWHPKEKILSDPFSLFDIDTDQHPFFKNEIFMLYTGLKDKHSRKIFEGDILKLSNWSNKYTCIKCGYSDESIRYGKVVWSNYTDTDFGGYDRACYCVEVDNEEYELTNIPGKEVIGNIYENPELLKATK